MESTREIIVLLKQVKEEKKLSLDKILAMMENNNQFLSKSTLARIFAEGSEEGNFRYETLRPVCETLLDIEHIEDNDDTDIKAYKSILKLKKDIIDELSAELETEKLNYYEKLQEETDKFQRSLDFVKHQVELKDQRIDDLLLMNKELTLTNNKLIAQLMECPLKNKEC